MTIRLDEVLELLPDTGLTVRRFDQWPSWDGGAGEWVCILETPERTFGGRHFATPLAAITAALAEAGFNLEDDGT